MTDETNRIYMDNDLDDLEVIRNRDVVQVVHDDGYDASDSITILTISLGSVPALIAALQELVKS